MFIFTYGKINMAKLCHRERRVKKNGLFYQVSVMTVHSIRTILII